MINPNDKKFNPYRFSIKEKFIKFSPNQMVSFEKIKEDLKVASIKFIIKQAEKSGDEDK
ncbi:hypothetical protein [Clostridium frigidicarnis]|nr:hypothetical protein [Clostridium frigidicarnis]